MQIKIMTKRGTVELSFSKLRIFRRLNRLEERMRSAEERIKKLVAVAERGFHDGRYEKPVPEPERREDREAYTPDEVYLAWTEGEEAVRQLRAERERELSLKGGRSA